MISPPDARPGPRPLDATQAEQLALELGGDVAFVCAAQGVFFARREIWPPVSPVLRLLRGLYELEPQRAHWIARNRIFSTSPASASCVGAKRVAARQLAAGIKAAAHGLDGLAGWARIDAGAAVPPPCRAAPLLESALAAIVRAGPPALDDAGWLSLAGRLASEMRRWSATLPVDVRRDKPVAALLVAGGSLLGWATNTGARNATAHAEVNLVESWLHGARLRLPRGSRIYSTLKPCAMCAGFVWDSAEEPLSLQVFYAEDDPLRYARETVLDAGSMARRHVARNGAELRLVLQRRLA